MFTRPTAPPPPAHQVREEVHCAACGKTTHQNAYTQYFYNTQVGGWAGAGMAVGAAASMQPSGPGAVVMFVYLVCKLSSVAVTGLHTHTHQPHPTSPL